MSTKAKSQADGVVYTPLVIVRHILRHTLNLRLDETASLPRILDPACGEGAFLVEAYRQLLHRFEGECGDVPGRIDLLRQCVFGIDCDERAVEAARRRLAELVLYGASLDQSQFLQHDAARDLDEALCGNLRCGDALTESELLAAGRFQVIVANPPFIGARRLAGGRGRIGESFRDSYRCVQGSCDLYVVFLERIIDLVTEGGRFGLIAPNRITAADYAHRCRELLLARTRIERIDDVSGLNVFPSAAVYPLIICGQEGSPQPTHNVVVSRPDSLEDLGQSPCWFVAQRDMDAKRGFPLRGDLELESRVPTRPLGELAALHSGTTGFAASRIAAAIQERDAQSDAWDFITTGNIDRYRVQKGDVRFLGRTWHFPVLPCATSPLTQRKRRLYREAKIVIAGLSRRPEAAWSAGELALGVQVYAAADFRDDPFYVLGILNSKLFAQLFRTRFAGRRMSGGYLGITKSQLARLPICAPERSPRSRRLREEIAAAALELTEITGSGDSQGAAALEERIDAAVYELYQLRDEEIARIEAEVATLT
jgi:hypothetical protein